MKQEEINNEIFDEIEKEIKIEEEEQSVIYNDIALKKSKFMNMIYSLLFKKLLTGLKIRIIVSWKGKEIFDYEIPKD